MLYSSRLFLLVPCCKDHWVYFLQTAILCIYFCMIVHYRLLCDRASSWSIDRSIGRWRILARWNARKKDDEQKRTQGLELILKTGKSLATDLRGEWAVRASDATLLPANENPTPDSVVLYVLYVKKIIGKKDWLETKERVTQSGRMVLNCSSRAFRWLLMPFRSHCISFWILFGNDNNGS